MARIELENVSLTFRMTRHGPAQLRDWLTQQFGIRGGQPIREIRALREMSFRLSDGDRVGVVGPNGAGKSTLLKVLADIYPPTSGRRLVEGRVSALFNVLLGFEPFATGWENIRYRGYLQGENRLSMREKIAAIGAFSELEDYLDLPVRYYSTGMRTRLGFSIATAIEPDILLVDEAINAGDIAFRAKAKQRIRNVMSSASIVVVASHDHQFLQELCARVLWVEDGTIRADGRPAEVIAAYEEHALARQAVKQRNAA